MANAVVNRQVNVYINSGEAAKAYDVLIKREKLLNAELAKTTDPKRIKQLTAELDKLKDPIDRAAKKMKGELAPSIRELELATRKFLTEFKKTGDPETLRKFQQFQAELNKAKLQLNDLGAANKGLTSMGIFKSAFWANLAAGGIAAAGVAIKNFFSSSFDEALSADESTQRLKSTLENLGRSDAFDRITRKANDLAATFSYLDNDDIVAVFNKLIDYGKLTEKQMNDLLPVIIDFAAKSKISIDESASIIIKALEGNGKALKEYGINIKDAGSKSERLALIMTTLKSKVEGSGEAFLNSAKGGLAQMTQESANLKEELGNGLLPMLVKIQQFTLQTVNGLRSFFNAIGAELKGNSGFIQIALDEVEQNPELRKAVVTSAEATVRSVLAAQSQIEEQLGRKLNLKNKQDAEMLKTNQEVRIKGIEDAISRDNQSLAGLIKSGRRADQLEARSLKISILARTKALEDIRSELNPNKNTLGIDPGGGDKENAELKKAIEEREKLLEELKKIEQEQRVFNISEIDKELALMEEKYSKLRERAKGETEILLKIEELYAIGRLQLIDKFVEKEVDVWKKGTIGLNKQQDELIKKNLSALKEIERGLLADPQDRFKRFDRNRLAGLNLDVLKATGRDKLKAQLDLLKEQERQELDAKDLTENEKLLIEEEYRRKRKDAENNYLSGFIQNLTSYASQALQVISLLGQAQTDKENQDLENNRRINDKKKNNLDQRLKKGLISQIQYDREIQKIEAEQEKREKAAAIKQYRRKQQEAIFSAVINNAQGITKTIAENGFPKAIPLIIAQGIVFLAQMAAIVKQKPPEFAQGGRLGGRSHSAGGNAVIDGSGRKIAEVEAGEGIVNKRTMADRRNYSVSGTPSQIISRLNGMYGTSWEAGATLIPGWRSYSPQRMNYSAMKRMYADGGVMNASSGTNEASDNQVFENLAIVISNMQATLDSLQEHGIVADVSLNRFEQQQDRLTAIRRDATLRG